MLQHDFEMRLNAYYVPTKIVTNIVYQTLTQKLSTQYSAIGMIRQLVSGPPLFTECYSPVLGIAKGKHCFVVVQQEVRRYLMWIFIKTEIRKVCPDWSL